MNTLSVVHDFLRRTVKPGAFCIDATAGRGRDTALLCELAGEGGRVLAFDVQEDAVRQTNELLAREGKHAEVHLDSHAHMESYAAPESVDCIVFNFGRLPGGDPHIFTHADSSIEAVNAGLRLLKPGGVMALAIYYGGENGYAALEAAASLPLLIPPVFGDKGQEALSAVSEAFLNGEIDAAEGLARLRAAFSR